MESEHMLGTALWCKQAYDRIAELEDERKGKVLVRNDWYEQVYKAIRENNIRLREALLFLVNQVEYGDPDSALKLAHTALLRDEPLERV